MPLDSLKLPSITVQQGRSPGSSPVVRLRSKEKEICQRYQLTEDNDQRTISLPRLFGHRRSTSFSKDKYLHQSFSSVGDVESDDGSMDNNFKSSTDNGQKFTKWSPTNFDQIVDRPCSQESLPQLSPTGDESKPRSNSYGNNSKAKFATLLASLNGKYKNKKKQQQRENPKSTVLFEEQGDESSMRAWSNKNTYFTTAKSADSILQLMIDDFSENE